MVLDINKIVDIIKDPDLKLKINELYGENLKLKEENHKLKKQIEKTEDISKISKNLKHEDNHYFLLSDEVKDGPYCTKCWDADNKLIRLHKGNFDRGVQYYSCPNCKTTTETGTYIPYREPDWIRQ